MYVERNAIYKREDHNDDDAEEEKRIQSMELSSFLILSCITTDQVELYCSLKYNELEIHLVIFQRANGNNNESRMCLLGMNENRMINGKRNR